MRTGLTNGKTIRALVNAIHVPFQIAKRRIFCISMQRNGTTSVGDFLLDHGFRVARWRDSRRNNWTFKWQIGDYESIFNSIAFKSFQAFEDDPWWMPDFYRILNCRFPTAKFILFYRDSDSWFDSMVYHSNGKTLGNTYRHCKIYRRLSEYYYKIDNEKDFSPTENEIDNLMYIREKDRDHYKLVYEEYNRDVIEYFNKYGPEKIFVSCLEEGSKWLKLGDFLGIKVDKEYDVHRNKSQMK